MFEIGERVLLSYEDGETEVVTVTHIFVRIIFVEREDGTRAMATAANLSRWAQLDAEIAELEGATA